MRRRVKQDPTDLVERRLRIDPLIGTVLHGYRLEALIGEGSAARVYRARHLFLDRMYAVKVLSVSSVQTHDLATRFEREARTLSEMSHPNVVSVIDFGMTPCGRPFLTMELLEGRTLQEVMQQEGGIEHGRIRRIARQLAGGLAEAHRHRIVHRDLKPANVMLVDVEGLEIVKILDFGIARASDRPSSDLTAQNVVLGTPRYMAPEQVMNPTSVSPASDLYSLGVVIYEMLTGHAPFDGGMMEVLDRQMNASPPPLATHTGLEVLVERLLSKKPEDRPKDAAEVMRALDRAPAGWRDESSSPAPVELQPLLSPDETVLDAPSLPLGDFGDFDDPTELAGPRFDDPGETDEEVADETEEIPAATIVLDAAPARRPRRVKRASRRDRLAAILACIALVLGFSVVALAAVSVQRRLAPEVVVVQPR